MKRNLLQPALFGILLITAFLALSLSAPGSRKMSPKTSCCCQQKNSCPLPENKNDPAKLILDNFSDQFISTSLIIR